MLTYTLFSCPCSADVNAEDRNVLFSHERMVLLCHEVVLVERL